MKLSEWSMVAAEVLNEPSPRQARVLLAHALLRGFGAQQVARVRVDDDGTANWYLAGDDVPPPEALPTGADVERHPLHRFHVGAGVRTPSLLTDALAQGWRFEPDTWALIERLHLTLHQFSLPIEWGRHYDGWVLVSDEGFPARAVSMGEHLQALIVGLDRHIRLLAAAGTEDGSAVGLTARETVVLHLMARGLTATSIGARLRISPRTVHKHQERLYRKLGAVDRLSAVLRAQEAGALPPQRPGPLSVEGYSSPS